MMRYPHPARLLAAPRAIVLNPDTEQLRQWARWGVGPKRFRRELAEELRIRNVAPFDELETS